MDNLNKNNIHKVIKYNHVQLKNEQVSNKKIPHNSEPLVAIKTNAQNNSTKNGNAAETYDDVKSSCMNIFLNFAKLTNCGKEFSLSHQNLCKILRTVNLLDQNLKSYSFLKMHDVDVILKKVNPNGHQVNANQFMNFIVLLSDRIDHDNFLKDPRMSVLKIVKTFFEPFAVYIEEKNNIDSQLVEDTDTMAMTNTTAVNIFYYKEIEKKILLTEFDDKIIKILNSVYVGLSYLYKAYFHYEVNPYKEIGNVLLESLNSVIRFCKNFEICPYYITLDRIAIYYNIIIDLDVATITQNGAILDPKKDLGKIFTLSKFLAFIVHAALFTYDKYLKHIDTKIKIHIKGESPGTSQTLNYKDLSNCEKLLFFLDKLNTGNGLSLTDTKISKPFNSSMTLIPPSDVITEVSPIISAVHSDRQALSQKFKLRSESRVTSEIGSNFSSNAMGLSDKEADADYRILLSCKSEEVLMKYESYMEILKDVFEAYTSMGDKLHFHQMTFSGYVKFLKDFGLMSDCEKKHTRVKSISMPKSAFNTITPPLIRDVSANDIKRVSGKTKSTEINTRFTQLNENDASLIFHELCGVKNFNFSQKIRQHFDRNSGITFRSEDCNIGPGIDKKSSFKGIKSKVPLNMNFALFLKSFELLAVKLHPEMTLDQAMIEFFEHDISDHINKRIQSGTLKKGIVEVLNYIRKDDINLILGDIQMVLLQHFMNYADIQEYISFQQYFEFVKDFGIFPDIANLLQIKAIFFSLSELLKDQILKETYSNENSAKLSRADIRTLRSYDSKSISSKYQLMTTILKNNDVLNFELFTESLAIAALYTKVHEDASDVEKIIRLVEKMCQSNGILKSQKKSGRPFSARKEFYAAINQIKEKYSQVFEKKSYYHELIRSPTSFEDIFSLSRSEK